VLKKFNFKVPYMFLNRLGYNIFKGAKNEPNPCDKYFEQNYRNSKKTAIKLLKSFNAD